jgi:O-antigen ligase
MWLQGAGPLLLAAGLLFLVLLGGTEAGRVSTGLRAAGALLGAILIAIYLWRMPRQHDLADRLVLGGLLVFLVTCVSSTDPRASFDAATSAIAYAAAFYLARGAVASRRGGEMAITVLGSLGIVIGVAFLILWGSIWVRWAQIPGSGLPPFDLRLPAYLYRHQYPIGNLAVLLLPASLVLARRPKVWPVALIGTAASFIVAFLSGGRAIWLAGVAAVGVAAVAAFISARGVRGPFNRWSIRLGTMAVIAALVAVVAVPFLSRLGATSTIDLRLHMWQTALAHWLASPVVGYGPGSFQREFSLTGYYSQFEPNAPHAHNVLVQVLFEGGIVGLIGLALVCAGLFAGVAQHRRLHWSSAAALSFFVFASAADNPTVVPFLLGPLIVWAALASPRERDKEPGRRSAIQPAHASGSRSPAVVDPLQPNRGSRRNRLVPALMLSAGAIAIGATCSTLAAAWAFDRAGHAASSGQTAEVVANLSMAVTLDPAFALYHRELGVWRHAEGDLAAARDQLVTAIRLNPADNQAYRAAALLYASEGSDEAIRLAWSTVALQATHVENALTLAYVSGELNDWQGQHDALVAAVRFAPWLTAAPEWAIAFPNAEPDDVLTDAYMSWRDGDELSARNLKARAWLAGLVGAAPPNEATPALQAEAAILACRPSQALQELSSLEGQGATELETLGAKLLFDESYNRTTDDLEILIRLRDPGLAGIIARQATGASPVWSFFYDNRYYDRVAITPPGGPVLPTPASGLSAWLRDPTGAADRGAPGSGLAKCS